jgi:predicted permease
MLNPLQDIRYGLRTLRSHPGFTIVAVLSLALGIGANTAIFSLVDLLLLRSLPVRHPQQLVRLASTDPDGFDWDFSSAELEHFRQQKQVFQDVLATADPAHGTVSIAGREDPIIRQTVCASFFSTLGVQAAVGRTFQPGDQAPVVISFKFWKRRFARDPAAVGQQIIIDKQPATIVGVAPPEFFGVQPGASPDLWDANEQFKSGKLMARLQPGVTPRQARDAIDGLYRQMLVTRTTEAFAANPKISPEVREKVLKDPPKHTFIDRLRLEVVSAANGFSELREKFSAPLLVLMALVGLVLLIACTNVANLLLARASTRRREIAVRLALGASRFRLIRQLLTESLLLSGLGGIAGLLLSTWATGLLVTMLPQEEYTISFNLQPDVRILAFTAAISLLTGLLFGLAPAWGATRVDVNQAIKGSPGGARQSMLTGNRLLVVAETAACLVLLLGAGLFVRSLINLKTFDAGFERNRVMQVGIDWSATGRQGAQLADAHRRVLQRFDAVPGVRSASLSAGSFHDSLTNYCCVSVAGATPAQGNDGSVRLNYVMPRYFETMGTLLLAGRDFNEHDTATSRKVVVISETAARRFFGSANPIGGHFSDGDKVEIVGVAKDAKYYDLREPASPMVYYPLSQSDPKNANTVEVRLLPDISTGNVSTALRKALEVELPEAGEPQMSMLSETVDESIAPDLAIAKLSGFFGVLAMALACIGVYGVTSYAVARRTSEIGIRMALGARRADVLRMVLREAILLAVAGVAIGLPAAVLPGRWIASMLFGLRPYDPATLALAAAMMLMVALTAGYIPARRAAAVDPMVALRYE